MIALYPLSHPDQNAEETLDYLIDEWTAFNPSVSSAGIPARVELPDARPHFFPDTIRALAALTDQLYHIPQGVTLAQWALESKWGRSNLNASNYFGLTYDAVRKYMAHPACVWLTEKTVTPDGEIIVGDSMRFASFTSVRECFLVHAIYLSASPMYERAFRTSSAEKFTMIMARHYATDPEYAHKLIAIMRRYHL